MKTWTQERTKALIKIYEAAEAHRHGRKLAWSEAMEICKKEVRLLGITHYHQLSKVWSKRKNLIDGYCYRCGKNKPVKGQSLCPKCAKLNRETTAKYIRKLKKAGYVRRENKYVKAK